MVIRPIRCAAFLAMLLGATAIAAAGQDGNAQDKAAIAKNAEAFAEAFQKGDGKTMAGLWAPDGDYTSQSGRNLKGRDAIEKALQAFFTENKGVKVRIDSDMLRFITPDVAIEDGTTEVLGPDGPPSRGRYTIVHVKKDGRWFFGSVREAAIPPESNADNLRGLESLIGDWAGDTGSGEVEKLSLTWAENQSFVVASFRTVSKGVTVASATAWIGWDPLTKRIRCWIFDSTGAYGEGSFTPEGKRWVVKTNSVLQDGKKATATYTIASVDSESLTFQATERSVSGEAVPDLKEIKLKRVSQP